MLSFHNDISIKKKYLNRVIKHRELDNIIKGIGWENGKGCAVGCTLEDYNHERYPVELGIPIWLAKLEDIIFENLNNDESKYWPELFLKSIPVGVNLEKIKHQLSIIRINNLLEIQNKLLLENKKNLEIFLQVINSIKLIKKCHELDLNNNCFEWYSAISAAWSSSSAARLAAFKKESENLINLLKNCK